MTNYTNEHPEQNVHVFIGNEEWTTFSFENKVRLLYRLRQSETVLARELEKTISLLIEEEQKEREIDYEATLKRAEEDVSEWPE